MNITVKTTNSMMPKKSKIQLSIIFIILCGCAVCTSSYGESRYSMIGKSGDENKIKSELDSFDNTKITNKSLADDYLNLLYGIACSKVQTVGLKDSFFGGFKNYYNLDDSKSLDSLNCQIVLMDALETSLNTQKWDSKSLMELSSFLLQRIAATSKSIVKQPIQGTVSIGSSEPHISHVLTDDEINKIRECDKIKNEIFLKNRASSVLVKKMKCILGIIATKELKDNSSAIPEYNKILDDAGISRK
jgi:hypothetical protein